VKFLLIVVLCFLVLSGCVQDEKTTLELYQEGTRLMFDEKNPKAALLIFDEVIKRDSNFAEAYSWRAGVLNLLDRHHDAIVSADNAIRLFPEESRAYVWAAQAYSDLGDDERALEYLLQAEKLNPYEYLTLDTLAVFFYRQNDCGKVREYAARALKARPNDAKSQEFLEACSSLK
jgi:tetratricopeptide (TPR) repeat protein